MLNGENLGKTVEEAWATVMKSEALQEEIAAALRDETKPETPEEDRALSSIVQTSTRDAAKVAIRKCDDLEQLRVAMAIENHKDSPRSSIVKTIETRIRVLESKEEE